MRSTPKEAIAGLAVLLLASLACNALWSAPGGKPTQPAAQPPANQPPSQPPASQPVLLSDDFSSSDSGWGTGSSSEALVEYANGGLHMKIFDTYYFNWTRPGAAAYQNVHMEVTAKDQGGGIRAGFGILCDQQADDDSNYYYGAITPDGDYVIGKSVAGQKDTFLTNDGNWATSDLIEQQVSTYRLGLDCGPGTIALYVNGQKVDSVGDTSYTKGSVGLLLWSGVDAGSEVTYDDFVMTPLK